MTLRRFNSVRVIPGMVLWATVLVGLAGCRRAGVEETAARHDTGAGASGAYERIVSLAPSITEILFALDLDERVVGVTRFCRYPEAARSKAKVGGFEDISMEAVAGLRPDLVIVLDAHRHVAGDLRRLLACDIIEVQHETVSGILQSIRDIGAATGMGRRARALTDDVERRMRWVARQTAGKAKPSVLLTLGSALAGEGMGSIFIAGEGGFYDRMIELAGGTNAYTGKLIFPSISPEGLLRMDPDVIVELAAGAEARTGAVEEVKARWRRLPELTAVERHRVHVLTGDYVTVPGPRFIHTLEDLARVLHPEIDRDE